MFTHKYCNGSPETFLCTVLNKLSSRKDSDHCLLIVYTKFLWSSIHLIDLDCQFAATRTNRIYSYSLITLTEAIVDHPLKQSLETRNR